MKISSEDTHVKFSINGRKQSFLRPIVRCRERRFVREHAHGRIAVHDIAEQ